MSPARDEQSDLNLGKMFIRKNEVSRELIRFRSASILSSVVNRDRDIGQSGLKSCVHELFDTKLSTRERELTRNSKKGKENRCNVCLIENSYRRRRLAYARYIRAID